MIDLGLFGEYAADAIERNERRELETIAEAAARALPLPAIGAARSSDVIAACRDLDDSWFLPNPRGSLS
jgi:hypothetical protein